MIHLFYRAGGFTGEFEKKYIGMFEIMSCLSYLESGTDHVVCVLRPMISFFSLPMCCFLPNLSLFLVRCFVLSIVCFDGGFLALLASLNP